VTDWLFIMVLKSMTRARVFIFNEPLINVINLTPFVCLLPQVLAGV